MKFRKLNKMIERYEMGYDSEYSLDEIRQLVDESFDNNDITGDEYDELLEIIEEIDEF